MKMPLRRIEPWIRALVGTSVVVVGCALARAARAPERDPAPDAGLRLDSRHPSVLAGRLERTSPAGGYVDLHRPLDAAEQSRLSGYRDAARGPQDPGQRVARRDYVDRGRPRMPFDPRSGPARRP